MAFLKKYMQQCNPRLFVPHVADDYHVSMLDANHVDVANPVCEEIES